MNNPEKAEILLKKYLKKYGLYVEYKKRKVLVEWDKIIGREIFYLTPLFFKKDVLICKVKNPTFLQVAEEKKEEIKEKINNYLKEYKIKDIKIIK